MPVLGSVGTQRLRCRGTFRPVHMMPDAIFAAAEALGAAGAQPIPARPRKLHLGHFAFIGALVQGTDTRASQNRYLRIEGEYDDAR